MWTFDNGIILVRELHELAHKNGYHISLGGSVLYQGFSNKDVDIIFLPIEDKKVNPCIQDLQSDLREFFGKINLPENASSYSSETNRRVIYQADMQGKRVDLFLYF